MGLTVTPAYRVAAKFAREARGLPLEESVDYLERNLRAYVHQQISSVQAILPEMGERSAVAQLGDPEVETLTRSLETLEEGAPKDLVEEALALSTAALPSPDLNARILLLPVDWESRVLVQQMKGVLGVSFGSQVMVIFLWPADEWREWLGYTVAHEYTHLARNHLFHRGPVGGRLVYVKTHEPETLLYAMIAEGVGDAFAHNQYLLLRPAWAQALSPSMKAGVCPKVHRRLGISDPTEIRRILFGDNDRIPKLTGYTIGYQIVKVYLQKHPSSTPANLVSIPDCAVFDASGYITPPVG